MPNYWFAPADAADVDSRRHSGRAKYTFVDGHGEARRFESIYQPARHVDAWHPGQAQ